MYRAGTPTDNSAMEAINGWLKEELFNDFKIKEQDNPIKCVEDYINFFNNERPSYSLNYLTPKQFKFYPSKQIIVYFLFTSTISLYPNIIH